MNTKRIFSLIAILAIFLPSSAQFQGASVFIDPIATVSNNGGNSRNYFIGVGAKYQFDISSVKGLGIVASVENLFGGPNKEQKNDMDDACEKLINYYAPKVKSKGSYKTNSYSKNIYLPIMGGVNYSYSLNDNFKLFWELQCGPDLFIPTKYKVSGNYYYSQASTQNKSKTNTYSGSIDIINESDIAIGWATSFSFGCMFNKHLGISLHYNYMGSFNSETNQTIEVSSHEKFFMKGLSSLRTKDRYETSSSSKTHKLDPVQNKFSSRYSSIRLTYHF